MNFPKIPGYEIEALAGQGGMGAVYRARQTATGRQVALKLLTNRAPSAETMAAFQREAELIAGLEHPHILPVYDFGQEAGIPYLVMRHLGGGSLADKVKEGPVKLETAVRWLTRLADALDFAHQQGIVHKDVKPSNALLDEAGQVYLTDFGIAGAVQAPGAGIPMGSAAYMSPEQCRGEAVDARSDVYALAVMLFELLTGQKPYTAENALGVMFRQIHDPVPAPRAVNADIPPAVELAAMRGMAKDPAHRPASAAEFARELSEAAAAKPQPTVVAPPAALPAKGSRLWRLTAVLLAIPLCLVVVALFAGGGAFLATLTAETTPALTRLPRPEAGVAATAPPTVPATPGELLRDDFSRSVGGFATGGDEDGGVAYESGALAITALTAGVEWFSPSGRVTAADLIIEVAAQTLVHDPAGYLGLVCRWRDINNYTLLALSGAGEAAVWQKQNGETVILADWRAAAVAPELGQSLRMRAVCSGDQLRLSANNILLIQVADPAPISGDIALMAGLREAGEWQVRFDDLFVVEP